MSVLNPEIAPPQPTPLPAPASPPRGIEPGQIFVMRNVSYAAYVAMSDAIPDRPAVRFTYDRGTLEIKGTSNRHEWYKGRFGRAIDVLCEAFGRATVYGGSQTLRSDELEKGFEPDQCYWIANEARVRIPFFMWHPDQHPPPDLVVEIEVTRSAIAKLELFAAYRIPEVWRFDEKTLRVHVLRPEGGYEEVPGSPTLPGLPLADLVPFILPEPPLDSLTWTRQLREWAAKYAPAS